MELQIQIGELHCFRCEEVIKNPRIGEEIEIPLYGRRTFCRTCAKEVANQMTAQKTIIVCRAS